MLFLMPGQGELYLRAKADTSWTQLLGSANGVNLVAVSPEFAQNTTVLMISQ